MRKVRSTHTYCETSRQTTVLSDAVLASKTTPGGGIWVPDVGPNNAGQIGSDPASWESNVFWDRSSLPVWYSVFAHILLDGYHIRRVPELVKHNEASITMICTHELNRGGRALRSPLNCP